MSIDIRRGSNNRAWLWWCRDATGTVQSIYDFGPGQNVLKGRVRFYPVVNCTGSINYSVKRQKEAHLNLGENCPWLGVHFIKPHYIRFNCMSIFLFDQVRGVFPCGIKVDWEKVDSAIWWSKGGYPGNRILNREIDKTNMAWVRRPCYWLH